MQYLVWQSSPVNNACRLAPIRGYERSYELTQGVSLATSFPKDARAQMDSDFKKATALTDDLSNMNGAKICSKRLVEFLKKSGVRHVEYLPLVIVNHKGKVASTEYFIVNPVGLVEALDLAKSKPVYNSINREMINTVERTVLDPKRVDPERKVFRLKGFFHNVLVEKGLADAMVSAGMVGPYFRDPETVSK